MGFRQDDGWGVSWGGGQWVGKLGGTKGAVGLLSGEKGLAIGLCESLCVDVQGKSKSSTSARLSRQHVVVLIFPVSSYLILVHLGQVTPGDLPIGVRSGGLTDISVCSVCTRAFLLPRALRLTAVAFHR